MVAGQIYRVADCCFAIIQKHRLGIGGNRISAWLAFVIRFHQSADDVESAWVGEGNRFKRSVSLHAQPDLSRHGVHVDRLPACVRECVGNPACASFYFADEQTGHRARRGISGEKVWGGVHRLQVPCEAVVVIKSS